MLDGEQLCQVATVSTPAHNYHQASAEVVINVARGGHQEEVMIMRRREVSSYAVGGRWYQHSAASLAISCQYSHC